MDIDSLLNYYFKDCNAQPLIEVFDTENIYNEMNVCRTKTHHANCSCN